MLQLSGGSFELFSPKLCCWHAHTRQRECLISTLGHSVYIITCKNSRNTSRQKVASCVLHLKNIFFEVETHFSFMHCHLYFFFSDSLNIIIL